MSLLATVAAAARAALDQAAAQIRSEPHWLERAAAGALRVIPAALTQSERRALTERRERIALTRAGRKLARERPARRREAAASVIWRGIALIAAARVAPLPVVTWCVDAPGYRHCTHSSRRAAALHYLRTRDRDLGRYRLRRETHDRRQWMLEYRARDNAHHDTLLRWPARPSRRAIASAIRMHRRSIRAAQPDRTQPDTLGWRAWLWDAQRRCLVSPHQRTAWAEPELRVADWDESDALRGVAGIHARRMPRDWRYAGWLDGHYQDGPSQREHKCLVTGVIERFGRYVLGTQGWRAEWVVIRELMAPDVQTMLALMQVYPEVRVHLSPTAEEVAS